ncbi:MAG: prephenate dehydratase [Haliscomenobacter sp.]|uniref:prephenate dehydratase n=1 Tax=Haliscomenobacter sp. TaxID=2717303 RepID=UPI0029BF7AA2|nr:prephenate dehydratase [Haliscomenobacter sp.]MDX2070746.1 prephenate dehydratase [Haliscomenobacter sp.]
MQTLLAESEKEADQETANLRVGIQGFPGAFHEIAARLCFEGRPIDIVPCLTFEELVEKLEAGEEMDAALMAIENSLAGSLMANYKLLDQSNLMAVGEVYLRVKQNLMVLPGVKIEDLTEVHSHPVAIEQCLEFFRQYPHIQLIRTEDTALSARNIREKGLKTVGAIASTLAADLYEMEMLAESIETNKKNYTRFLVLQRADQAITDPDADKVSISFGVSHTVGSLHKVLAILSAYNFNMSKIQSAPIIGQPWEYRLFIDYVAEGHVSVDQAYEALRPVTHNLKLLGAYKQGILYDY